MAVKLQIRRGTTPEWSAENPVLAEGEVGIDLTENKAKIGDGSTAWNSLAYGFERPVVESKSDAYTLVFSDAQKTILHPSADTTARIFTIPANASVAFPVGTRVYFVNQNGAGVVTIAITSDTMRLAGAGTTGSRTLAANGYAEAVKLTSTEWLIWGTGLT